MLYLYYSHVGRKSQVPKLLRVMELQELDNVLQSIAKEHQVFNLVIRLVTWHCLEFVTEFLVVVIVFFLFLCCARHSTSVIIFFA